jgi:hypothetical protein
MIWREKRALLIILGLILLANTIFFFTYRVQYQSRLDELDARLAQVQGEHNQARIARLRAEQTFVSYRKVEKDVLEVFNQHWSTQPERFTKMFAEVTRLAVASSLVPRTYSFGRGEEKRVSVSSGPRREALGATEVSIAFGVAGTYQQARRLINLLELSQQFVIIESITLNSADQQTLTLDLELKTIFRDEETGVASNRL